MGLLKSLYEDEGKERHTDADFTKLVNYPEHHNMEYEDDSLLPKSESYVQFKKRIDRLRVQFGGFAEIIKIHRVLMARQKDDDEHKKALYVGYIVRK